MSHPPHCEQSPRPGCPMCYSQYVKRNGTTKAGQSYLCKMCGHWWDRMPEVVLAIRTAGKSGVFPEPVREREWKPLRRDPFELMRLAMVTRG